MTKKQAQNIFYYLGVMLIDNKIINTSPDYLIEKSLLFLGQLGKDEFISEIKNIYYGQIINLIENRNNKFWLSYCKIWKVDENDYKIMNIINFILGSKFDNTADVISKFKKYIGDVELLSDSDLSFSVHPKSRTHIDSVVDLNCRYLKLMTINSINKNKK